MTPPALAVAAMLLAVVATPAAAGPEKVAFPAEYKKNHVLYATVDRPDNKTVRDLYASPEAARAAAPGQPLPDRSVLTMEVYKAKLDDKGDLVKDANGRLARTAELVGIFVMEKRRGWGADIRRRCGTANGSMRASPPVGSHNRTSTPSRAFYATSPWVIRTSCSRSRGW